MNNDFYIEQFLPISKKTVQIKQISNKTFFDLQKFIISQNNKATCRYLNNIIQTHVIGIEEDLNIIDKAVCLLKIRSISCGDTLKFVNSLDVTYNITIDSILEKINNTSHLYELNEVIANNIFEITIDTPRNFIINQNECLHRIIKSIRITGSNECVDFNLLDDVKKDNILVKLDSSITIKIYNLIALRQKNNICISSKNESLNISEIAINPYNQSMFEFIKLIFKDDLVSCLKNIYVLCSKAHIEAEYIMSIAPAEGILLLNMYVDEVEEQKKQLTKLNPNLNIPNE